MPGPRSHTSTASSETGSDPEDFSDWASSLHGARRTKSLFDAELLDTPEEALDYDEKTHGYNVKTEGDRLGLDDYARIRLINYIRREAPGVDKLKALELSDVIFQDETNLKPIIENDPLLQICFDDSWSEADDQPTPAQGLPKTSQARPSGSSSVPTSNPGEETQEVTLSALKALQAQLEVERKKSKGLQVVLDRVVGGGVEESGSESGSEGEVEAKGKGKGKERQGVDEKKGGKGKGKMDIDTHYFDSYASNDIHETMLKDTVRTMSYGEFILNNPGVFKDAVVMDVGCGSGILSMFAAKAGAKHVYAIEASGLAMKARANIRNNGLEGVITVHQGKIEDLELGIGKEVDVVVSEWMGYMLLYEAMLDSVLFARDRYMRPDGLMVPSQTRIMLAGITGEGMYNEAFGFWDRVYGFDLSAMKPTKFEDGIVEVVDPKEIVTSECPIKDIDTNRTTVPDLDFTSDFVLQPTASNSSTRIRAFLTWFDTFFSPDSSTKGQAPLERDTEYVKYDDDAYKVDLSAAGESVGKAREVSFTTGPRGKATHWKQVAFLLKEPVEVLAGQRIEGSFRCRKSRSGNTRELDVEIHWKVVGGGQGDGEQRYDVFRVC